MSSSCQDPEILTNQQLKRFLVSPTLGPDDPIRVVPHASVSTALVPGFITTNVDPIRPEILGQTQSKPGGGFSIVNKD